LKKQMANIYNPEVVIADAIIKNRKDEWRTNAKPIESY
jgi:ribosomal protein L16 Arg81 hydroxylase